MNKTTEKKPQLIKVDNDDLIPVIFELLDKGHTVTLRLRGRSMMPFLVDNRDIALITKAKQINKGDAVLARVDDGRFVLHRIIKIEGDDVTLMGDGNTTTEHCKRENVRGFIIGFYRKGRKKIDKTNGLKWTVYSFIWMRLRPIRRYLLAIIHRTCKMTYPD